jgi:WD40 repeat protein
MSCGNNCNTLNAANESIDPNDCSVPLVTNDGVSSLQFSPNVGTNILISTNWAGGVQCWDVKQDPLSGKVAAIPKAHGKFWLVVVFLFCVCQNAILLHLAGSSTTMMMDDKSFHEEI